MIAFFSKRSTAVLLAIALALIIATEVVVRVLNPQYIEATGESVNINITHEEYRQALTKWKAHNVREYKIMVHIESRSDLGGWESSNRTLYVGENGNRIDEIAPEAKSFDKMTQEEIKLLKEDTIEGMFSKIDKALQEGQVSKDYFGDRMNDVRFDPQRGYPSYLRASPEVVGADWRVTVQELKVIN